MSNFEVSGQKVCQKLVLFVHNVILIHLRKHRVIYIFLQLQLVMA